MRRARALLLAALLAMMFAPARAADTEAVGWWWRAQAGLVVEVPPPPNAPAGGMVVSAGPDGPTAVGAVRWILDPGEEARMLRLDVEGSLGTPTLLACPSAIRWAPAEAGRWESRPTLACDLAQSSGLANEDGTAWSFDVTGFAQAGVLDVVVLPDVPEGEVRPDAFEVRFAAPGDDALTVAPSSPEPDPVGSEPSQPGPDPTEFRPVAPPPPGRAPGPPAPVTEPSPLEEPTVAAPEPSTPSEEPSDQPPVAAGATGEDDGGTATAAAALLIATAGLLWSFRPRATADPTVRGLSRWRTPRAGPPPPIV